MAETIENVVSFKQNVSFEELVEDFLYDARLQACTVKNWAMIRRFKLMERWPRLRDKVFEKLEKRARLDFAKSGALGEWGDGEFAKWLFDWWVDNWPTIEKIIIFIIKLV